MTGDDHVLARDLAGQAGQRLLELRAQGGDPDVLRKAGDRLSHEFLTAALAARRPGDVVLSEEGADNPARLGARRVWIVDPLDGTTNFAHSFPVFCVSIALEHKGKRVAGVIYDPTRDELFTAEKGSGAYLNQRRIHVSKVNNMAECLCGTGFPSHKRHKNPNIHFYHQITLRTHGVRRAGSAALDLASVATWPSAIPSSLAQALTMCSGPSCCDASWDRRHVLPSTAISTSPRLIPARSAADPLAMSAASSVPRISPCETH